MRCTPGTPGICHVNATCTPVTLYVCSSTPASSYRCECNQGYSGNGFDCTCELIFAAETETRHSTISVSPCDFTWYDLYAWSPLNFFAFSLWAQSLLFSRLSYHRLMVPYPWTAFSDLETTFRTHYAHRFVLFSYHYFFFSLWSRVYSRLISWLSVSFLIAR